MGSGLILWFHTPIAICLGFLSQYHQVSCRVITVLFYDHFSREKNQENDELKTIPMQINFPGKIRAKKNDYK